MNIPLTPLLLLAMIFGIGCGSDASDQQTPAPPDTPETYPLAPAGLTDSLADVLTSIDFIFHELPISMSVSERSGIRNLMTHFTPGEPQVVNHGCQPIGRITYVASGEVLYFGDLYFAATCSFVRFYTKNMAPTFTMKLNHRGMEFLTKAGVPMTSHQ